jgi:hypothetical protein
MKLPERFSSICFEMCFQALSEITQNDQKQELPVPLLKRDTEWVMEKLIS